MKSAKASPTSAVDGGGVERVGSRPSHSPTYAPFFSSTKAPFRMSLASLEPGSSSAWQVYCLLLSTYYFSL